MTSMIPPWLWQDPLIRALLVCAGQLLLLMLLMFALYQAGRFVGSRLVVMLRIPPPMIDAPKAAARWRWLNRWLCLLLATGVVAIHLWLLYHERDSWAETLALLGTVSLEQWASLGMALVKVFALVWLVRYLLVRAANALVRLETRWRGRPSLPLSDDELARLRKSLYFLLSNAAWLLVALFAVRELQVSASLESVIATLIAIYLIVGVALIIWKASASLVLLADRTLEHVSEGRAWQPYVAVVRPLNPMLRRCLEYAVWIAAASLVMAQLPPLVGLATYGPRLIEAIGVVFIARVVVEAGYLLIDARRAGAVDGGDDAAARRHATITPLMKTIFRYLTFFVALVMVLGILGIDIMPFLAGAGILGVVIGFGAQPLINDIVSGFFILFENTFLVGDLVETSQVRGVVERIDFRTTRLRDAEGNLHVFRNGEIGHVKNYSKDFTLAVVEVRVGYDADVSKIRALLTEAGRRVNEELPELVDDELVINGIVAFEEHAMRFRTATPVKPAKNFVVANRLREIIKALFDEAGVAMPRPQMVISKE